MLQSQFRRFWLSFGRFLSFSALSFAKMLSVSASKVAKKSLLRNKSKQIAKLFPRLLRAAPRIKLPLLRGPARGHSLGRLFLPPLVIDGDFLNCCNLSFEALSFGEFMSFSKIFRTISQFHRNFFSFSFDKISP